MPATAFLSPGAPRGAGRPAPLNGGLLTENPIRFPVAQTLYVRKTGSDANGGSGLATTATGADGVTDGSPKFTSPGAVFDGTYVDELINVVGAGRFRIEAVIDAQTLTLSANAPIGSGLTWKVGGAVQTVAALLGNANDAVREGDTIWVGSGVYRETIIVRVAPRNGGNNDTSRVSVNADVDGAKTGDSGPVRLTAFTTDDKTAPSTSPTLFFPGVSFFSFASIFFQAGSGPSLLTGNGETSNSKTQATTQRLDFTDCSFIGSSLMNSGGLVFYGQAAIPLNMTFDRCRFVGGTGVPLSLRLPVSEGADWDIALVAKNCLFLSTNATAIAVTNTGVGTTGKPGGGRILNSFFWGGAAVNLPAASWSLAVPMSIANSVIISGALSSLVGGTLGQLVESNNLIAANTPRSNVNVGAGSISDGSYALLFHFGQELQWGGLLRGLFEPMAGSPLLGFGNDGNQTSYDLRNQPRPAGGASALPAVGALERSNTFAKETSTVHTGSNAISATGPAYQDFLVPVASGTSYAISVYVNYDGSYTGTAPQLLLLNGTEAGVADQTVTAGGSAGGGWTQISLASIAPTSSGFVTVRLLSNDTSGVSEVVFDTFAVA